MVHLACFSSTYDLRCAEGEDVNRKIIPKVIVTCDGCPHGHSFKSQQNDEMRTIYCKRQEKFLGKVTISVDTPYPIPDDCPLEDASEDMLKYLDVLTVTQEVKVDPIDIEIGFDVDPEKFTEKMKRLNEAFRRKKGEVLAEKFVKERERLYPRTDDFHEEFKEIPATSIDDGIKPCPKCAKSVNEHPHENCTDDFIDGSWVWVKSLATEKPKKESALDKIKCPNCGKPASEHPALGCDMTYGRRGWRQLGVYDG
jgi:ssDNA-binding Zn-finger/Zn-ribbon topoisomerase 1